MIYLEDGKPLVFGKKKEKVIRIKRLQPVVANRDDLGPDDELLIHIEDTPSPHYAYLLTQMTYPEMPVPFGVFREINRPTYEGLLGDQVKQATEKKGPGNLKDLIYGANTWTVD